MTRQNRSKFIFAALCVAGGWLAAQATPWYARAQQEEEAEEGTTSLYGFDIQVRKAGELEFTEETKRVGVEVLRDENTGNVVYISETGSIAVVPPAKAAE